MSHHALFYRDQRELLACIAAFAHDGLARSEPVLIAVPGGKERLVGEQLGQDSGNMAYADIAQAGRNPARIIPAVRSFIDQHPGRRIRFVEEPLWPQRSAEERYEVAKHEALINFAFAGMAASILCLYAADGLADSVTGAVRRTHPEILTGGRPQASSSYAGAEGMAHVFERPLPAPPVSAEVISYLDDLRPMRRLVENHAGRTGLSGDRTASLVLAASELAANTLRHTSGGGTLRVWHTRREILCQVEDEGWITDPLAGRRRRPAAEPGHGLWLVNQVCDLVELRSGQIGTTVRVHMRISET
ncbi:MAG: sensor histidine kinase [Kitasatospora sp.]|nr:sensor histidine kinase [Kitasatospora sp.]